MLKLRIVMEAAARERKAMCVLYAFEEWLSRTVKELRLDVTIEAVLRTKVEADRERFRMPYLSRLTDSSGKVFLVAVAAQLTPNF
jgi:hypothetical protein